MEESLARIWNEIVGRTSGPVALRFILQPLMATFLAVRSGLRDARAGRPAFLWTVVSDPAARRATLKSGWQDIGKVFVIACALDGVYQVLKHHDLRVVPMLVMAVILAVVPYALLRGPVTRVVARCRKDTPGS